MGKFLLFVCFAWMLTVSNLYAQSSDYIVFKNKLVEQELLKPEAGIDIDKNGHISYPEARKTIRLNICVEKVKSKDMAEVFEDIAHFKNVVYLRIFKENYRSLSFDEYPNIVALWDFKIMPNLQELNIESIPIKGLILRHNSSLKKLIIYDSSISELDLSNNKNLIHCDVYDTCIDVMSLKNNSRITTLRANVKVPSKDISSLVHLKKLERLVNLHKMKKSFHGNRVIYHMDLDSLDLSRCKNLDSLVCSGNNLTKLKLHPDAPLVMLDCSVNKLSELKLPANNSLVKLNCSYNNLTMLELLNNTRLRDVNCENNELSELKLPKNDSLKMLYCSDNKLLKALDVSTCSSLRMLYCSNSKISLLNLPVSSVIAYLHVDNNSLKELDLSAHRKLETLDCSNNGIRRITLPTDGDLKDFKCENNLLKGVLDFRGTKINRIAVRGNSLSQIFLSKDMPLDKLWRISVDEHVEVRDFSGEIHDVKLMRLEHREEAREVDAVMMSDDGYPEDYED